jgi:hypothetical protein
MATNLFGVRRGGDPIYTWSFNKRSVISRLGQGFDGRLLFGLRLNGDSIVYKVIFGRSLDNKIFIPTFMIVLEDKYFFSYWLSDLASAKRFWIFLYGFCEEDYPHNICSGCYVFKNGGCWVAFF